MPAPKWMTQGIPLNSKEIETGYELDPDGSSETIAPLVKRKITRIIIHHCQNNLLTIST